MSIAEGHVSELLRALGEDPDREGLRDTPRRVVAMLQEMCRKESFYFTAFDAEGADELIVQTQIPFVSLCEHHIVPFVGTAAVGYIPHNKIVGLSKLARAVIYCAKGLQTQERITRAVAEMIEEAVHPRGIGVVLRAQHLCMTIRGVKAHDTWTITSCLKGVLLQEPDARAEFLDLVRSQ